MSPAQSEDSGLAADRGTTYATISLPRENAQAMGIVFLGKFIFFVCNNFRPICVRQNELIFLWFFTLCRSFDAAFMSHLSYF